MEEARDAEMQLEEANARAEEACARADEAEARVQEANARADEADARAQELERENQDMAERERGLDAQGGGGGGGREGEVTVLEAALEALTEREQKGAARLAMREAEIEVCVPLIVKRSCKWKQMAVA